ncbi:TAXI family TRAP transporter solute-binding subunit [Agromyces larvae]|uniref:TAXI family TRAP transporter solute-binding subunit n=1 Tax=Agromyces larvae TaxID=2929802 RepID=A0ABY4BXJ3_9MICO|nr:TAXI family TRAP transporter solute-binding subunit [Agromyces larvae]UOE43629.1 TAXI family TRAP transporter solute-binding subunit [Agromyces larvae]
MTDLSRRAFLAGVAGAGALGAAVALAGCAPSAEFGRLRMACGEPGGTYIRFGQLLGAAVVDQGVARAMAALPTDGSVENLAMLRSGDAELAIALADSAAPYAGELVAIGRVYQNYLQCIVRVDGGIARAADLAGRVVSIGAPGSGTALMSQRAFEALGLAAGPAAAVLRELALAEAVGALGDGSIDAVMWSGGIPLPELARLDGIAEVTLVDLTEAIPAMNRAHGDSYATTAVPAGTYGLDEAVPAIGVSNFLLARGDLPGPLAAALVDILIDRAPRLVPEPSVGLQYLTSSSLIDTGPMPLHSAAARRYRERYG